MALRCLRCLFQKKTDLCGEKWRNQAFDRYQIQAVWISRHWRSLHLDVAILLFFSLYLRNFSSGRSYPFLWVLPKLDLCEKGSLTLVLPLHRSFLGLSTFVTVLEHGEVAMFWRFLWIIIFVSFVGAVVFVAGSYRQFRYLLPRYWIACWRFLV